MVYLNRGMYLESLLNYTIENYNNTGKALIFKSTPKIVINQGKYYYFNQSTVDYHGVYQGKYLCFEAKMTKKTILPWSNIRSHQWNFLILASKQQAYSFLIIYFSLYKKIYLVFTEQLVVLKNNKKTLTFTWIKKNGYEINFINPFLLDFIELL